MSSGRTTGATLVALALALAPASAGATGLTDHGEDLEAPREVLTLDGYFRMRGALLSNLDLDRGPTPSGQLLYPVPVDDPTAQTLTMADMRWRADLGLYHPDGGIALKARIDALDNVALGSAPDGVPSASATQRSIDPALTIRRVYAEVLTPFGLLAAGRMGNGWGLGMLANGGDCLDCDSGDSADRIAFVTPLLGHFWAFAWDFTATGPFVPDRSRARVIDVAPTASVYSATFAFSKYRGPAARARRNAAGKVTPEYGSFVSYRFQESDIPATYLPTATPIPITTGQVMQRGYQAVALDLWLRFEGKNFRVEAEGAYLHANVEQASLVPGVLYRVPVTSNQLGLAVESEFGDDEARFRVGLDGGYASGDASPGFGAFPRLGQSLPRAGDLEGPQANPPFDAEVNNFRFHPDYRIDRILFREIIGTVTDAIYVRPHVRYDLLRFEKGTLSASLAAVVSFASAPESTLSGDRPLGVELDPTLRYTSDVGFEASLDQGTLIPLSGLDNVQLSLPAKPAQLWRLRLAYRY